MVINNRKMVHCIEKSTKPRVSLLTFFAFLTVVCVPFMTIDIGGVGILFVTAVPMFLLAMMPMLRNGKITIDKGKALLLLFLAYQIVAMLWSPSASTDSLYVFLKVAIVTVCLYCISFNSSEKKLLIIGSCISCALVCYFMLSGSNSIAYVEGRATIAVFGAAQDPNYIAYTFFFAFAVCLFAMFSRKSFAIRALSGGAAILIFYCVLLTGSRGSWLSLIVLIVVFVLKRNKNIWATLGLAMLLLLAVFILYPLIISVLPEELSKRFTYSYIMHNGGSNRAYIWEDTINVLKANPGKLLLGFGTGSSVAIVGRATHNYPLQLILECGLVGFSLFLGFVIYWIKRLWNNNTICLCVMMASLVMALTLSVNTSYYFWVTLMLCIACRNDTEQNETR